MNKKKRTNLMLLVVFGILIGVIMTPLGLIPNRDLKDYNRLESGEGKTVQAESTGGASVRFSGKRGGSTEYCTSWRWELDGNERFWTDRTDCYGSSEDAPSGTTAELIYDPGDLGTVFVHSAEAKARLESNGTQMKILSAVGAVVLIGSIIGLVKLKKQPPQAPAA